MNSFLLLDDFSVLHCEICIPQCEIYIPQCGLCIPHCGIEKLCLSIALYSFAFGRNAERFGWFPAVQLWRRYRDGMWADEWLGAVNVCHKKRGSFTE